MNAFESELKDLARKGAAGLIIPEEQDRLHEAILKDEMARRHGGHGPSLAVPRLFASKEEAEAVIAAR